MKLPTSPTPLLMLAPMEGLTNAGMRELILEIGGVDVVATEFVRITSSKQTVHPIPRHRRGQLQIQLMASEPDTLAGVIAHLKKKGILFEDDWIDLNVGCPSRRVNAHGAGAALLKEPKKLKRMILETREVHQHGLLSMKTRLGYDSSEHFEAIVKDLRDAPLDLITIHARSKCNAYDAASLELNKLQIASSELPYPVIGNGDIFSPQDAISMLKTTGVAGCMCGRGAISNPYIFNDIRSLLLNHPIADTPHERRQGLLRFAERYLRYLQDKEALVEKRSYAGAFKEFATWFSRNPLIGKEFFQRIKRMTTLEEMSCAITESSPHPSESLAEPPALDAPLCSR